MDFAGGTLSYEGIDVLRRVETQRSSEWPGLLSGLLGRFVPIYTLKLTSMGEAVEFDYGKTMRYICGHFTWTRLGDSGPYRLLHQLMVHLCQKIFQSLLVASRYRTELQCAL
jgi:hypothetical protein